jgi:hypothetical protein
LLVEEGKKEGGARRERGREREREGREGEGGGREREPGELEKSGGRRRRNFILGGGCGRSRGCKRPTGRTWTGSRRDKRPVLYSERRHKRRGGRGTGSGRGGRRGRRKKEGRGLSFFLEQFSLKSFPPPGTF